MKAEKEIHTWIHTNNGKIEALFEAKCVADFMDIIDRGLDLTMNFTDSPNLHLIEDIFVELKDYKEIIKARRMGEL